MKRKIYSIIVIICTIFSVVVMAYFNNRVVTIDGFRLYEIDNKETVRNDSEKNVDNEYEDISNNEKYEEDYLNNNIREDENNTTVQAGENNKMIVDSKNDNDSLDNNNVDTEKYSSNINEHIYNDGYKYYSSNNSKSTSKDDVDELLNEETASVFKVNKSTIPSKISNQDKLKMLRMANSLSIKDYKAVAENIKRSDELPAATDIFTILKNKLSNENYKELKDILNPYINIDLIEKNINKNKR